MAFRASLTTAYVVVVLLTVHAQQILSEPTCATDKYLNDCGYLGIDEKECEELDCCWDSGVPAGSPWCFYKNAGYEYCSTTADRSDCGRLGVTEEECLARSCCWDVDRPEGSPWCYFPNSNNPTGLCPTDRENRVPCDALNQDDCESMGCCWSPLEDGSVEPWCFAAPDGSGKKGRGGREKRSRRAEKRKAKKEAEAAAEETVSESSPPSRRAEKRKARKEAKAAAEEAVSEPPPVPVTPPEYDTCCPTTMRVDCGANSVQTSSNMISVSGWMGVTEEQCLDRGCCYDPSQEDGEPWCYTHNCRDPSLTFCKEDESRVECGNYLIDEEGCTERDCCWNPASDASTPACFFPNYLSPYDTCCPRVTRLECGTGARVISCLLRNALGDKSVKEDECLARGCCWGPLETAGQEPWCYRQNCNYDEGDICSPLDAREDCGFHGVDQQACEERNCCWAPLEEGSVEPWCFYKNAQEGECCDASAGRIDCGEVGTTEESCSAKGCCWNPLEEGSIEPWCFYKNSDDCEAPAPVPVYLQPAETPEAELEPAESPETELEEEPAETPWTPLEPAESPEAELEEEPAETPWTPLEPAESSEEELEEEPAETPWTPLEPAETPETELEPAESPEDELEVTETPELEGGSEIAPEEPLEPAATPEAEVEPAESPEDELEVTETPELEGGSEIAPEEPLEPTATPEAEVEPAESPEDELEEEPAETPWAPLEPAEIPEEPLEPAETPWTPLEPSESPDLDISPAGSPFGAPDEDYTLDTAFEVWLSQEDAKLAQEAATWKKTHTVENGLALPASGDLGLFAKHPKERPQTKLSLKPKVPSIAPDAKYAALPEFDEGAVADGARDLALSMPAFERAQSRSESQLRREAALGAFGLGRDQFFGPLAQENSAEALHETATAEHDDAVEDEATSRRRRRRKGKSHKKQKEAAEASEGSEFEGSARAFAHVEAESHGEQVGFETTASPGTYTYVETKTSSSGRVGHSGRSIWSRMDCMVLNKVPCGGPRVKETKCLALGCCWEPSNSDGVPNCYNKEQWSGVTQIVE